MGLFGLDQESIRPHFDACWIGKLEFYVCMMLDFVDELVEERVGKLKTGSLLVHVHEVQHIMKNKMGSEK